MVVGEDGGDGGRGGGAAVGAALGGSLYTSGGVGVGGGKRGKGGEAIMVGCQGGSAGGVGERGGLCDVEEIREVERGEAEESKPWALSGKALTQVCPIQSLMPLPNFYKCQEYFGDSGCPVIELRTVWGFRVVDDARDIRWTRYIRASSS